jgi:hypothetical protein
MNGETRNLVAIISKEKGHSNNKAIEIVHKILLQVQRSSNCNHITSNICQQQ